MDFVYYVVSFFIMINVIVFVHEYGHYLAAVKSGVKVVKFSLGMGPEICGFTDKYGTRWFIAMFPIGGYIMMLGDDDPSSSTVDEESLKSLSESEKESAFVSKSNWQKMLIAFAGPFFNYLYAFIGLFLMALLYGAQVNTPIIGEVVKDSPAFVAGFLPGDRVVSVDGKKIDRYREILIEMACNEKDEISFEVDRNSDILNINVKPKITEVKKLWGGMKKTRTVGLVSEKARFEKKSFDEAIFYAFEECFYITKEMLFTVSKLFSGKSSIDNVGGVVHMASVVGDLSKSGNFALLILFSITLSINLGFINLLPLPVLDGGRILISAIEQIFRKKLNKKLQEYIMMTCAILLFSLMLLTTVNDISRIESVKCFISKFIG